MTSASTLFISIASYRDNELYPTLIDLIDQAQCPARLRIVVCWQDDGVIQPFLDAGLQLSDDPQPVKNGYRFHYRQATVEVLFHHYFTSRGAGWARHQVEQHYQDEDFFLQIDSHCRFTADWDSAMIAMLEGLRPQSPFPVLSSYPPGYIPGEDEQRKDFVSRLIFNSFTNNGVVSLTSTQFDAASPQRCGYLAAGFVFADGHFVKRVANDPQIFFMGEEIAMAARAWTHGYDIWTPHQVLLWHYYGRNAAPKVWGDHNTDAKEQGLIEQAWWERDRISTQRVLSLLNACDAPDNLGQWGLGDKRSLQEFQQRIGIDFRECRVHPAVIGEQKISWFIDSPLYTSQWRQLLRYINQRNLQIPVQELDATRCDIAWWHIGVYSKQNQPLMVKQYSSSEMQQQLQRIDDDTNELRLHFLTDYRAPAHSIRICPYLINAGWGELVERSW